MAEIDSIPTPLPKRMKTFNLGRVQRDLICGSVAGFVIVFSGHPCEYSSFSYSHLVASSTIKVRMQMLGGSFWKTLKTLVKEEGVIICLKRLYLIS